MEIPHSAAPHSEFRGEAEESPPLSTIIKNWLLKPEAYKSNNPGYIRGRSIQNITTPEWVEVFKLKLYS